MALLLLPVNMEAEALLWHDQYSSSRARESRHSIRCTRTHLGFNLCDEVVKISVDAPCVRCFTPVCFVLCWSWVCLWQQSQGTVSKPAIAGDPNMQHSNGSFPVGAHQRHPHAVGCSSNWWCYCAVYNEEAYM